MVSKRLLKNHSAKSTSAAALLLLLCSSLLFLCGCVYLRLLEFKHQLIEFDRNFHIEEEDGFILHFHDPMLFDKDVLYLTTLEPTRKETVEDREKWTFLFEKLAPDGTVEDTDKDVFFVMRFNERKMLTAYRFSPVFLAMIPPDFLVYSLRTLGFADVDKKRRRIRADSSQIDLKKVTLPTREMIEKGLGKPFSVERKEELPVYTYKYHLDTPTPVNKKPDPREVVATVSFDPETDEVVKVTSNFIRLKLSVNYRRLKKNTNVDREH